MVSCTSGITDALDKINDAAENANSTLNCTIDGPLLDGRRTCVASQSDTILTISSAIDSETLNKTTGEYVSGGIKYIGTVTVVDKVWTFKKRGETVAFYTATLD